MEFLQSNSHINEWAAKFAQGDSRAAEKLFDYFYSPIYRYIFSRTRDRDTAEDITQDVFLKLARSIRLHDPARGNFSAWLWQIVRNTFTDYLRAKGRRHEDSASYLEIDPDAYSDDQAYDDEEQLKKVDAILKECTDEEQELFRMRYIAGMTYDEIAAITKRTPNAVTVATHRIREKIKKAIHDSAN